MTRTATVVLHPVWDRYWSRPGYRLTGVAEALQPETRWVCVRDGEASSARRAGMRDLPALGDESRNHGAAVHDTCEATASGIAPGGR